jgi:outer membrane lipoprotein LolB
LILASGCAQRQVASRLPGSEPEQQPRNSAEQLLSWRFDGRIAVQRGDEGWSATIRWTQDGDRFQLRLVAPLGRGTYQLVGDQNSVRLVTPEGDTFSAADPESLMQTHLGWQLPLPDARFWVRGLPAPAPEPDQLTLDERGRLRDMAQDGWRVSVLRYVEAGGFELPAKLFLNYGDVKVRLVITAWTTDRA